MNESNENLFSAIDDFHKARSLAALKEILARFTGQPTQLLSYDEVREKLKVQGGAERGLQDIPINKIVGSVGRYNDFTREFLPRSGVDEQRWARVLAAASDLAGLPPIEVYKIGDAYFVKDGNHRVSVARQLGATHIQAYVTEIRTRVSISSDITLDELILKAEYADFLELTHLDELRPQADLTVTVPGQYQVLAEHIAVHHYFMGIDLQRDIPSDEAVIDWYENVYMPVVQIIQEKGILRYFPGRTETDLYLWIAQHRAEIEEDLGWNINPVKAAIDLVQRFSPQPEIVVNRLGEKFLDTFSLEGLESGPTPGEWRKDRLKIQDEERLFHEILVPVNGQDQGWYALEYAIIIARRENAHLHGLHVLPTEEEKEDPNALSVRETFNQRCRDAGVDCELVFAVGEVSRMVCNRSRWTDLIVATLSYPPPPNPLFKITSGARDMIQRCPRPILATPRSNSPLDRALLAYDGSPKSEEALFIATYLAGQWQIPLFVITVLNNGNTSEQILGHARDYIESHQVTATYFLEKGSPANVILKIGENVNSNFYIMGGYGANPVKEIVLGSVVDEVLRLGQKPVLISR
jgi:nucleotide-binding universal stress UspA family protein